MICVCFLIFTLFRYPGLWRKQATGEERKRIETQGIISAQSTNNITLVRAQEIDDIIDGIDEKVSSFKF